MTIVMIATVLFNKNASWVDSSSFDLIWINTYLAYFKYFLHGLVFTLSTLSLFKISFKINLPLLVIAFVYLSSVVFWYFNFTNYYFHISFTGDQVFQILFSIITGIPAWGIFATSQNWSWQTPFQVDFQTNQKQPKVPITLGFGLFFWFEWPDDFYR